MSTRNDLSRVYSTRLDVVLYFPPKRLQDGVIPLILQRKFYAYFYSLNSQCSGTGTLGVPFAVMQGGYMSLVAIIIISMITNYTGKLIIECLYEKPFNDQGTRGVRLRNSYALIGKRG